MSLRMVSKISKIALSWVANVRSNAVSLCASSSFSAMVRRRRTNARMISMLIAIAVGLFRTDESIATPCSVNAWAA